MESYYTPVTRILERLMKGGHQFKYSPATQGDSVFHKKVELNVEGTLLIAAHGMQRQRKSCELKFRVFYTASSRIARAI